MYRDTATIKIFLREIGLTIEQNDLETYIQMILGEKDNNYITIYEFCNSLRID